VNGLDFGGGWTHLSASDEEIATFRPFRRLREHAICDAVRHDVQFVIPDPAPLQPCSSLQSR